MLLLRLIPHATSNPSSLHRHRAARYNSVPYMPRASLHTLGCRRNHAETALLGDQLRRRGDARGEGGQPTELVVVNTCSVTDNAEADCRSLIRRIRRTSPDAFVAVTGCYAQTGVDVLQQMEGIDLIVGTQYKMELPRYLTSLAAPPHPKSP